MKNKHVKIAFWMGLFVGILLLAVTRKITDSEFWAMTQAKELGNFATSQTTMYAKILFYSVLKIFFFFDMTSVDHVIAVRVVFAFISTVSLFLVYLICRRLRISWVISYGIILFLFFNGFYNTQMYTVRADILAQMFALLCLYYCLICSNSGEWGKQVKIAILALLTFLCTPKSIYLIVCLGVFLFFYWKDVFPNKLQRTGKIFLCLFFPIILIWVIGSVVLYPVGASYMRAIMYYKSSFVAKTSLEDVGFRYLVRMLIRSPFHSVLMIVGMSVGVFNFFRLDRRDQAIIAIACMATVSIVIHNQRFPFFISSLLPFACFPVALFLSRYSNKRAVLLIVGAIVLDFALFSPRNVWGPSGGKQKEIMNFLEKDLMGNHPMWKYFDGIGSLPRRDNLLLYIGPNDQATNDYSLQIAREVKPEVILYSARMFMLEPHITVFLMQNYKMLGNGIYISNAVPPEQYKDVHYTIDRDIQTEFDYWSP